MYYYLTALLIIIILIHKLNKAEQVVLKGFNIMNYLFIKLEIIIPNAT